MRFPAAPWRCGCGCRSRSLSSSGRWPPAATSVSRRRGRGIRRVGGMGVRAATALSIAATAAALLCAPGAGASSDPANVQWETLLPAMPSSARVQPHSVPFCRGATVRCVDTEVRRLRAAQDGFRCDHRAVFSTTYLELTRQLRKTLRRQPRFFRWPRYLYVEDALFADVYFNTLHAYARGRPVPPAWRIALNTARAGQV